MDGGELDGRVAFFAEKHTELTFVSDQHEGKNHLNFRVCPNVRPRKSAGKRNLRKKKNKIPLSKNLRIQFK